jgi:glycosyltransferase involved in cell wall biosynthesis
MTSLVSVVVPVYNGEHFLAEALDSALAQTFRNLEVIVVDDGSIDASGAIADRYATAHPQRVRVIHQANAGLVYARNAAIDASRGRYLALLDADDVWMPHHLAEAVAVLEREPETNLVHANIECMDAAGHPWPARKRLWRGTNDAFTTLLLRREHVSCPTAVFRRSVIDAIGAFDPAFNRLGCEDRDLWLRIAKFGGLRYLDSVHARYRVHGANMSGNAERMMCARLLLIDRHVPDERQHHLRKQAVAAIHVELGDGLFNAGRRSQAFAAYLRALTWSRSMEEVWRGVARCLLRP